MPDALCQTTSKTGTQSHRSADRLPKVILSSCACVLSHLSRVQFFATPRTIAHQAPLSMAFSREENGNGLPFPFPRDLPNPGMELMSSASPALAGGFFTTSATWEAHWSPSPIFYPRGQKPNPFNKYSSWEWQKTAPCKVQTRSRTGKLNAFSNTLTFGLKNMDSLVERVLEAK